VAFCVLWNQENHFDQAAKPLRIGERFHAHFVAVPKTIFPSLTLARLAARGKYMSGQVVLYFDDQSDALRFALAAGSVMAGEGGKFTRDLLEETARVSRIRLDAANAGNSKKANSGRTA